MKNIGTKAAPAKAIRAEPSPPVDDSDEDLARRIKRVKDTLPTIWKDYESGDTATRFVFAVFKAVIDDLATASDEERERILTEAASSSAAAQELARRAFETKSIQGLVDALPSSFDTYLEAFSSLLLRLDPIDNDKSRTTPGLLARPRPKQTYHALHRVEQAYADHKNLKTTRDGDALVHSVTNRDGHPDPIEVLFAPINSRFFNHDTPRFFPPPTLPDLLQKLNRIGSSGAFTFAVVISLAVAEDRPQINLNDLIKELGLDPRSLKERDEYRALLWECFQVFAQTLVVGKVQGNYRDKKGARIELIEQSPVIAITGKQHPHEMRLDGSETPVAVEYTLGSFFYRHRDNRQLLAYIGDLRQLAKIPRGKAAGQWACSIGLALFQHWRESATREKALTRRELFQKVLPHPNPSDILGSTHPNRARLLFNNAVQMLVDAGVVAKPPLQKSGAKAVSPRKGWQSAWLDEPIDLRPHSAGNAITVGELREIADANKARRRRTRSRKKTAPKSGEG